MAPLERNAAPWVHNHRRWSSLWGYRGCEILHSIEFFRESPNVDKRRCKKMYGEKKKNLSRDSIHDALTRSIWQRLGPRAKPKSRRPKSQPGEPDHRSPSATAFLAAVKSNLDNTPTVIWKKKLFFLENIECVLEIQF